MHRPALRVASPVLVCLLCLLWPAVDAAAVDLGMLVMPGEVIVGHADVEKDCGRCHRAFDAAAQEELCLECHPDVKRDRALGMGLHGLANGGAESSCRDCHTDHLGRDADIVGLDPDTFDHGRSDMALEGAHRRVRCSDCHLDGHRYRETPHDCLSCHRRDDRHRGRMGEQCEKCHTTTQWSEIRFDHSRSKFPLEGAHVSVDCGLCHPEERYTDTPASCNACHRLNDVHRGRFGGSCEQCHSVQTWRKAGFDHDRETRFPLRGGHRSLSCRQCHTGDQSSERIDSSCVACHRADDDHDGGFGPRCARCHSPQGWKKTKFDHRRDAKLELEGRHRKLPCTACHRGTLQSEKLERRCTTCHAEDDVHRGQEGERCDDCHRQRSWLDDIVFDHDVSRFPLLGLHALAGCEDCHARMTFRDESGRCVDCHRERDVHESRLGPDCSRCHNPNDWLVWRFDHRRQSRFPLRGAHRNLNCLDCHDTPVRARISLSKRCESCHALDDPHRGSFGLGCGNCHGESRWQEARVGR